MKIAVHLARHRRLVAWVGLSLLLHLLAFAVLDVLVTPSPPPDNGAPLALRLVDERLAALPTQADPAPAPAPAASPPASAAAPALPLPALPVLASPPALPDPAATTQAPAAPAAPAAAAAGIAPLQMPGRYRVRLPPSARLRYTVTRSLPGQSGVTQDSAQLLWEKTGGTYRLRVDGVLGELSSEGGEDDAGIAPHQASEGLAAGAQQTRFDHEQGRIEHGLLGASTSLHPGSQDRASALLQLAGMGLADPDQIQGPIDIVVAGPGGTRIEQWQVVGNEDLPTSAGRLATVRLAQPARPGETRVELWLAPAHHWLPVQLRVTGADGTVANQVVSSIESDPQTALQ
ncbi:DUF3108 domain-containing protein [Massilia sp. CMS3.1]|uniref:hypothetical protein n=1 Tax=Massilia sp. CMS3.1 TaxID=3373083 RepID=UPI003EE58A66